jgi:hypothetical protein
MTFSPVHRHAGSITRRLLQNTAEPDPRRRGWQAAIIDGNQEVGGSVIGMAGAEYMLRANQRRGLATAA